MKNIDNEINQYIVTRVGKELLAINVAYIDSIVVEGSLTRVPDSQKYFKGVINLRGDIIPVMSLRIRVGMEEEESTSKTRFVILKLQDHSLIGVIVDEVKEVITLDNSEIERIGFDDKKNSNGYGMGVGKYQEELITILNIKKLVIENEVTL